MIGLIEGIAETTASLIGGIFWDRVSAATTFYFGTATATLSAELFMILIIFDQQPAADRP